MSPADGFKITHTLQRTCSGLMDLDRWLRDAIVAVGQGSAGHVARLLLSRQQQAIEREFLRARKRYQEAIAAVAEQVSRDHLG